MSGDYICTEMVSISAKVERLERVDVNKIVDDSLREIEKLILELNQKQLYDEGVIDVKNPGKREKYSKGYIRQKQRYATFKKTEFVTLKYDGDFYNSFKLIIFDKVFVIQATDLKWANWLEPNPRFENALGLTDESKEEVRQIILPVFLKRLKNEL
jgi:hypothetical protein